VRATTDFLLKKLRARDEVSDDEAVALAAAVTRVVEYPADAIIVADGSLTTSSSLLVNGWAARSKLLGNGRRQITEIHVPGDFIDLHSFLLKRLDHDVIALSPCRIGVVPHDALKDVTERYPHLTRLLWLSTVIDAAIHRTWITTQGRMTAVEQVAHLLCELYVRMDVIGEVDSEGFFAMPLTQEEFGDACGLTSVHVNRMAQQLRGDGLVEWRRQGVRVLDWPRLRALAMFDAGYLNLELMPR
jgi:CRP-like cAMP-binding protein